MLPLPKNPERPNAEGLRVARWVRVSTEEQSKEGRAGLERQYAATNAVIRSRGYQIVESFEVIDVSGTNVGVSEPFRRLVRLIDDDESRVDAVIVAEVSRFMRPDAWESLAVYDLFARRHCLLIADGQSIDFSNPEGFLTGGIFTLLAGHERMKMVQKIAASKDVLRRQGKLASADHTLPFAVRYDRKAQRYSYDPAEIWRVQEAFRLIDEDGVRNLTEVGRRVGLKRTGLRCILTNPIFGHGIRRYDTKRDPNVKRVAADGRRKERPKIKLPVEEIIEVKVIEEPAVTPERFARVQTLLEESRTNHLANLPAEKRVHLCTGYGRCGCCGEKLYLCGNGKRDKQSGAPHFWYCCRSQHPGKKGARPRCSNSWIRDQKLDAVLIAFANSVLTSPEILTGLIAGSVQLSSEVIRPFPKPGNDDAIAKLERKEKRYIEMCADGAISMQELKSERARIRKEIAALRATTVDREPSQQHLTVEELARLLVKGAHAFRRMKEKRDQKAILEEMFAEVFFRGESITAFRFHPSLLTGMAGNVDDFAQTVTLQEPFRIALEIPAGHRQCSKCRKILPANSFRPGRLLCSDCFRVYNTERHRRYRQKRKSSRSGHFTDTT